MKTAVSKSSHQQRARELGKLLQTPAEDVLNMVTAAGLDAVEVTLASSGQVTLPLSFVPKGEIAPSLDAQPGTLPVYLPAAMVEKLRAMGECIGLENGAEAYISEIIGEDLREGSTGAADIIASLWGVTNPEILVELCRIQHGSSPRLTHNDSATPPPQRFTMGGLHPNSNAYAARMAKMLRECCPDEATAAVWYRTIRRREIPPEPR